MSLAPGTWANKDGHWGRFTAFCDSYSLPALPTNVHTLVLYVTHLACAQNISYQGIKNNLSSIRTFHLANGLSLPSPSQDHALHHSLRGARKFLSKPVNQKLPVSAQILSALLAQFDISSPFRSLMLLSYLTFLRLSSLVPTKLPFVPLKHLSWANVHLTPGSVVIKILKTKTIQCLESALVFTVEKHPTVSVCLVAHLSALRSTPGYPSSLYDPVFNFSSDPIKYPLSPPWVPYTRTRAMTELKQALAAVGLNPDKFGWASFRRGPASDYLMAGGDLEFLRAHGGWESTEFRKYLAIPSSRRAVVSQTLQNLILS